MKLLGRLRDGEAVATAAAPRVLWSARSDRFLCVWPRSDAEAEAATRDLAPRCDPLLRLREVLHWDELGASAGDAVGLLYFVRRRAGLSYADFERHYRERHAPLAREHHPGIARYVQNFLCDPEDGTTPCDAVSELWFRSDRDRRERFYRDARSGAVIAEDVARFLDPEAGQAWLIPSGLPAPPGSSGSAVGDPR